MRDAPAPRAGLRQPAPSIGDGCGAGELFRWPRRPANHDKVAAGGLVREVIRLSQAWS
jgi:hypothetical protein